MERTLRVRTINFTEELWEFYKDRAEIIYEKDSEGRYPSMIRIHETQRSDFNVKFTVYMDNSGKKSFNKILDWDEAKRLDKV